jgi:glycosyltransferase involved in cell wall biosynthesis
MNRKKLSILLPTYNCGSSIRAALESVKWADEIVIVDSYSTDNTLDIANEYKVQILQHEYLNSAKQKNWALPSCSHEWVFQIDSDEVLEPDAENIIRNAIENATIEIDCFRMARKNHMLGKWVRYGGIYPDWEHRLFRKNKGQWFDREVHSNFKVSGTVETLPCHLLHFGMPDISKQLKNLDRYTRYEADELKKNNRKFGYLKWLFFPLLIFLHRYLYLQGFRDGWRGFFLARYTAFYYFLSHSKLKEMEVLNLGKSPSGK